MIQIYVRLLSFLNIGVLDSFEFLLKRLILSFKFFQKTHIVVVSIDVGFRLLVLVGIHDLNKV